MYVLLTCLSAGALKRDGLDEIASGGNCIVCVGDGDGDGASPNRRSIDGLFS